MADRGAFFGFVNFVREEVGRSLVGACHYVEGVQILSKKAKPDLKMREESKLVPFSRRGAAQLSLEPLEVEAKVGAERGQEGGRYSALIRRTRI